MVLIRIARFLRRGAASAQGAVASRAARAWDAGKLGVGAGLTVCFAGTFALITGVQATETYGADMGSASSVGTARSGQINFDAKDISRGGAWVSCGAGGQATELTCKAYQNIMANFPELSRPGGTGCFRAGPPDHGTATACDLMTNLKGTRGTDEENKLGDELARWLMTHHQQLGVKYVIWRQRIWNPSIGNPTCQNESTLGSAAPSCWRSMEDRGSNTQNHYDHVHVSFRY